MCTQTPQAPFVAHRTVNCLSTSPISPQNPLHKNQQSV